MRARIIAHREASQNRADQAVTQFDPRPYQTASTTVPTSAILAENVSEPMRYFPNGDYLCRAQRLPDEHGHPARWS